MYYLRNFVYSLNKFEYYQVKDLTDETLFRLAEQCFFKNINSSIVDTFDICKIKPKGTDYCFMVSYKYKNYKSEFRLMIYFNITDEEHYINSLLE